MAICKQIEKYFVSIEMLCGDVISGETFIEPDISGKFISVCVDLSDIHVNTTQVKSVKVTPVKVGV